MDRRADDRPYRLWTALVILGALVAYLAGSASVQLWDRDEAWYAQSSRQMVESGDWLVTRFLDQARYSKPIFVYWCQALSMKLLGPTEAAARLPSAIAATITLSILAWAIGRGLGARRAFYTVLIVGSSAMVMASAKMCLTDSVLLVFFTIAQLCLFGFYWAHCRPGVRLPGWVPALFWLAVAMGGLTKGPIVLAVLLASLVALALLEVGRGWRSARAWKAAIGWWRRLRPLMGLGIVLAVVGPWLGAVYLRDPAFLKNMLLEPIRHTTTNQDGQMVLPGYYLVAIWPTFFPWCLFLPLLLVDAWRHRRTPHVRFALAIVLGNWVLAEAMVTKLPHYLLPSYAALAFLCATALMRAMRGGLKGMMGRLMLPLTAIWMVGAMALAAVPWLPARTFDRFPWGAATLFAAMAGVYIVAVVWLMFRRRYARLIPVMGCGMLALVAVIYAVYLPQAWFLRMPVEIGRELRARGATAPGQVVMIGFVEPSVAFYQGGTIREADPELLFGEPAERWPRWVVTTGAIYRALREREPDKAGRLREVDRFRGIDYNAGAKSDLYSKVESGDDPAGEKTPRLLLKVETVVILEKN